MFKSFAQNFEDVVLWRALSDIERGFYIDVGAHHPRVDSVSQAFFEMGWRGIHVEPTPDNAALLRLHRPGDVVIEAAVSKTRGTMAFHEIKDTGLSTLDASAIETARRKGFEATPLRVKTITLDDILKDVSEPIHWLKVDVEGHEAAVFAGWNNHVRPWILVVESTLPGTRIEAFDRWESAIVAKDYSFAYFDGLNRYYVHRDHVDRLEYFAVPPNVFDGFTLSGEASSSFTKALNDEIADLKRELTMYRAKGDEPRRSTAVLERIRRRRKTRRKSTRW